MNRPFSPPPPPPADTSSSTPAFFAEDDDDDDVDDRRSIDDAYSHSHDHTMDDDHHHHRRTSHDSQSSVSTTSLILENISRADTRRKAAGDMGDSADSADPADPADPADSADYDLETGPFLGGSSSSSSGSNHNNGAEDGGRDKSSQQKYTKMDAGLRRTVLIVTAVVAALWLGGLAIYVTQRSYLHGSSFEHDPQATASHGNLRKMTREQVDLGFFAPQRATIQWVAGPAGEDGLLLETSHNESQPFLTAKDVRSVSAAASADGTGAGVRIASRTLVKDAAFYYNGTRYVIATAVPSRNMAKVLLGVQRKSNWRHSSVASYFVMDVAAQTVEPLVPGEPEARIQLAQWSPTSEAVSFTRADDDNNLYVRAVPAEARLLARTPVQAITTDGGPELFYGVPDWVYEEEVLSGASAAWWSPDGKYLAFLRTNETGVPAYPVQYFIQRPSGADPAPGEENYPEVRQIKYPKAGAHNPVVDLQFYEVSSGDVFSVAVSGDFGDDDRLITTVLWAGPRKVLVKETNRISDVLRVVVVDVGTRTGQAVRTVDVGQLDGGWFEISTTTKYVPADAARGRPDDGYIDTVVYNDGDHLGYFTPPENPEPIMLTKGTSDSSSPGWEVVDGPAGVDLERNLVYFVATIAGPSQRHVYSVNLLDGSGLKPLLDGDNDKGSEAFYTASFSKGAGYVLLENRGPGIPWQKVMTTPALAAADGSKAFEHMLEDNSVLAERVRKHALPLNVYGTLDVEVEDGSGKTVKLNYLERRPPHFNPNKKYPVLFQQYSGPGSQQVQKKFAVDFQSYVAAALGYVVVTVDPRGTGFMGRQHRVVVRGQLGVHEAHDHIAAAAHWAARDYVDADRLALWGWSYGGFTTLKTLEQDAGRHFRYGIAVAPVTDWRFYDSIYTERYMGTPQRNAAGYDASAVRNASALAQNVRFLVMHGVADDNVHMQNSLALLDRLDIAGVSNYDVHVFPDSDHSIYFHNGHAIVYDKIENWLVNAFNGEWLKVGAAVPIDKRAV